MTRSMATSVDANGVWLPQSVPSPPVNDWDKVLADIPALEALALGGGNSGQNIYASKLTGIHANSNVLTGGGTDDTATLQAAINALSAAGGGRLILDGQFLVSGLTHPSNVWISGVGRGSGLFQAPNCYSPVIRNANRVGNLYLNSTTSITGGVVTLAWNPVDQPMLTVTATGGSFTLSFNGGVTSSINCSGLTASVLQTALQALSGTLSANITVTSLGSGVFQINNVITDTKMILSDMTINGNCGNKTLYATPNSSIQFPTASPTTQYFELPTRLGGTYPYPTNRDPFNLSATQAYNGYLTIAVAYVGYSKLRIRNVHVINHVRWAFQIANGDDAIIEDCSNTITGIGYTSTTGPLVSQDGIDCQGPLSNVRVMRYRDSWGTDDMLGICTPIWGMMPTDPLWVDGDFNNGWFEEIFCDNARSVLRLCTGGNIFNNLTFKNVYGVLNPTPEVGGEVGAPWLTCIYMENINDATPTSVYGRLEFDHFDVYVSSPQGPLPTKAFLFSAAEPFTAEEIVIKNCAWNDIYSGSSYTVGHPSGVLISAGANINRLLVTDCFYDVQFQSYSTRLVYVASGAVVNQLNIQGCALSGADSILELASGGTIGTLAVTGTSYANLYGPLLVGSFETVTGDIVGLPKPMAFWTLGEASGSNALDSTFGGNTLTAHGTLAQATGPSASCPYARLFNGTTDYFTIADSVIPLTSPVSPMTMCFWVKFTGTANQQALFNALNLTAGVSYKCYLWTDNISFTIHNIAGSGNVATAPVAISTGIWYFVVVQLDAIGLVEQISVTPQSAGAVAAFTTALWNGTIFVGAAVFNVGADLANTGNTAQNFLNGTMGPLSIYNRLLSASELAVLFNNGLGREYP